MAQVIDFRLNKDEYLLMAKKAFNDGDILKAVTTIKNVLKKHGRFIEASITLGEIYSAIGAWEWSNATLFDALANKPSIDERDRIYLQLVTNFLEERKVDVAEYYLRDVAEKFNLQIPEEMLQNFEADTQERKFKVVYPRGDEYYQSIVEKAYELIHERRFDDAISLLDKVDARSVVKKSADHIALVCLMMKNDMDGVITNATRILKRDENNLSAQCTLATAFLMEDKNEEAFLLLDEILKKDYTSNEDILMILHLLINMEVHVEIVKYTKRLLETLNYQPHVMIWLSQALYNIGQKQEARQLMHKVHTIFGDKFPSAYFLEVYKKNPDSVSYSMGMPYALRIVYHKRIDDIIKMDDKALEELLNGEDEKSSDVKMLIDRVFIGDDEPIKLALIDKLFRTQLPYVESIVKKQLISTNLSFELMSRLMCYLLDEEHSGVNFNVVAQDRFKSVEIRYPYAFGKMPKLLESAYVYCLADIVFTDEEQNYYLDRLTKIINNLTYLDGKGKCCFYEEKRGRIARLKSMPTLVAVLLAKVYEEEEGSLEATIDRYNVDVGKFDKYFNIVFGD